METKRTYSLKFWIKMALAIFIIAIIASLAIYVSYRQTEATSDGTITVVVNNIDNKTVSTKRIEYKKSDKLYDLLCQNYIVKSDDTGYGHYLVGISNDDFTISTDGTRSWLWLELAYLRDGKEFTDNINLDDYEEITISTGIDGINIVDNMIIAINERDNNHYTTVFSNSIVIDNNNNVLKTTLTIIGFSVLGLMIGYILFTIIKDSKNHKKITVKDMALIAFLTALLFVQEELLSFLPNIQLTVFLIVFYSKKLGLKKTSLIVIVHVLLDNLVMGSISLVYTPAMLCGWLLIPLTINTLFKHFNSSLGLGLLGIMYAFIYSWIFIIPNVVLLNINFFDYLLADIIFEVLLALSSFVTIWLLYEPVSKAYDLIEEK